MLGEGIVQGLVETARNFFGSYVEKDRLTTVQYPEERLPLPEASRVFPFLLYDGSDPEAGLRCVACQICEKECPPRCIHIEKSKDKKPDFVGKPQAYPAVFNIDVSVCMSCQICVEVCPFDAIRMDKVFELSTDNRFRELLYTKKELAKPNEYYQKIHPLEAAETDERRVKEAEEAKAKAAAAEAAAKAKAAAAASAAPAQSVRQWCCGSRKASRDEGDAAMISASSADQVFVTLDHWIVGLVPAPFQTLVSIVIAVAMIIVVFAGLFALTTVFERKGLGRMQNRYGPNRVGPCGVFQPLADAVKSLTKEDVVPRRADHVVHYLAPLVLVGVVFLSYAVLPVGRNMTAVNLDSGVLYFFAVGAATELAVFMAGWSSHNKYSLLGAMRAIAQMISYEIPLILSSVAVVMIAGTLSTGEHRGRSRRAIPAGIAHWNVFTPWGLAGFILFMIAATAETNRSPFDLPEGESEIIAGYFIEYSGFKFALFFLAEYLEMFAVSGLGITLFLGGWSSPVSFLAWIPSWLWFFGKLLTMIFGVHLDTRDAAAPAHGSADEFRVEIYAADDADRDFLGGSVAVSFAQSGGAGTAGRCDTLAGLCSGDFCSISIAGAHIGAGPED